MIIKIKCDDDIDVMGVLDYVYSCDDFPDGTHLTLKYKIHKTTTAKQVEYVVEKIDTATASELAQRCNRVQGRYKK